MELYADTASLAEIEEFDDHPWVSGFTTNPTLFKAVGVRDPERHAKEIVSLTEKPVSIDGPPEKVWALGRNAIPKFVGGVLTNRVSQLARYNFTAICTEQHARTARAMGRDGDIISVFAGRILDTGRDPQPVIDAAKGAGIRVLWASTREVHNYVQAERAGCDIITMSPALIRKLDWLGKPLEVVGAETRAQFAADRVDW